MRCNEVPIDKSKKGSRSNVRDYKVPTSIVDTEGTAVITGITPGPPGPAPPRPVVLSDLPLAAQAVLGTVCQTGDCLDQQPICPPDPRITCQLIPADPSKKTWIKDWVLTPWLVANAQKGDLILCPGGSGGPIGGLLSQLSPPQHYTHMGIMTRDQVEIRHATASDDWLQDHPNGSIFLAGPQPSDGFQPDALRYGWPGTITQSIDTAYRASLDSNFPGALAKDEVSGKSYAIHALGFDATMVNEASPSVNTPTWKRLDALVVKPFHETTIVRDALGRIADAAIAIRGHYRFYSYSNAAISEDPKFYGPPALEGFSPDPKSRCNPWLPVGKSIPVVCSSFIWAAIQRVNAIPGTPKLIMDSRQWYFRQLRTQECPSAFDRHPEWGVPDSQDGLYVYDEQQRINAATALHEVLLTRVRSEIAKQVPGILKVLGGVLITAGAVIGLMALPFAVLAEVLGISLADAKLLVEWTSDMPDDVATQLVNAFASDYCDTAAKDSDNWRKPGIGHAVSPDNIINCWSSPLPQSEGGPDSREMLVGLYGFNIPVVMRPPQWQVRPLTAWTLSPGDGRMVGRVTFEGRPVDGAVVKLCCRKTVTHSMNDLRLANQAGVYDFQVPAGDYMASAAYQDPNTHVCLFDETPVSIRFGGTARVDFDLQPPPASNRQIEISGHMDIVSRVAFGHDWWGHPEFAMPTVHLGPYGRPGTPDEKMGQSAPTNTSQQLSDYGSVRVDVTLDWQPDFSVKVKWNAAIYDGDDVEVSTSLDDFGIPADQSHGWIVDLNTGGAWPDRAHIEFTIANNRQQ